jgi:hypothetical protein
MTDVIPMLEKGIAYRNWELVALCVMVRVAEAMKEGTEEGLDEMIDVLAEGFARMPSSRTGRCRGQR